MLATSIQKSRQHWMLKGMQQGILNNARSAVLKLLEIRFGNIPLSLKNQIMECDNLQKLKRAHRRATTVTSLNEFSF